MRLFGWVDLEWPLLTFSLQYKRLFLENRYPSPSADPVNTFIISFSFCFALISRVGPMARSWDAVLELDRYFTTVRAAAVCTVQYTLMSENLVC